MMKIRLKNLPEGRVHFVCIGGISMSGLAEILLQKGYKVSGCDLKDSHLINRLREKGADIHIGHDASHVHGADLVVYTAAVKEDNPELVEAIKNNIPIMDRASLIGEIMETFPYSIGIAGAHGKTTTTSMLSIILHHANLDPTVLVGGEVDEIGGNVRIGNSDYFVTEACEYHNSFLHFHPYMAVILNIDRDHLDYFKDIDDIYHSFWKYANLIPKDGYVIGCADDPLVSQLLEEVGANKVTFGINNSANWMAQQIKFNNNGCATYRAIFNGQDMGEFSLNIPGKHNIYNALAASAAAWALGVPCDVIKEALVSYRGTHRRFEIKGKIRDITVIDDYAHHPTEIKATLEAAKKYPHQKIWCIFQPHTYTRTRKLLYEFADSFIDADEVIITDIYAAREKDTGLVHSKDLAKAVLDGGRSCRYLSSFDDAVEFIKKNARAGDIVLTMGAGNIYEVGDKLLKEDIQ